MSCSTLFSPKSHESGKQYDAHYRKRLSYQNGGNKPYRRKSGRQPSPGRSDNYHEDRARKELLCRQVLPITQEDTPGWE